MEEEMTKEDILDLIDNLHISVYNKLKGKVFMQLESSLGADSSQLNATKMLIQRILKNSANHLQDSLLVIKDYVNSL